MLGKINNIHHICKYLTYKEWKQIAIPHLNAGVDGKYLTYKEWKLAHKITCNEQVINRKYLTYKEWKHHGGIWC